MTRPPVLLPHSLIRRALEHPDDIAFSYLRDEKSPADSITYSGLLAEADAVAGQLQSDTDPQDRVLLLYPSGLDFVAGFLGCLLSQRIPVPAFLPRPAQSLDGLHAIARSCRPTAILGTDSTWDTLKARTDLGDIGSIPWLSNSRAKGTSPTAQSSKRTLEIDPDQIAFLQYTSGSTGNPKGVKITHRNLSHNISLIADAFGVEDRGTVGVSWLPAFHDMGLIGNILLPVQEGARVILMPPAAFLRNPILWLQTISDHRAEVSGAPNFAYDLCVDRIAEGAEEGLDLSTWRIAYNGAEPIRAQTLERFAARFAKCGFRKEAFLPCYGLAESTLFVTGNHRQSLPRTIRVDAEALSQNRIRQNGASQQHSSLPSSGNKERTLVSSGSPGHNTNLGILDQKGALLAEGQVGEIGVAGTSVSSGYWGQDSDNLFASPPQWEGTPLMRTGDLGFISGGELFVTGRAKDVIIVRGRNHYPHDLERTAEHHCPQIRRGQVAAFGVSIEESERIVLVAELERTALRTLDVEGAELKVREGIFEEHSLPVHDVLFLKPGRLPTTSSGKVRRRRCQSDYTEQKLERVTTRKTSSKSRKKPTEQPARTERVEECLAWLRDYATRRLDSRVVDERRTIPPNVLLDFGNRGLLGLQVAEGHGGLGLSTESSLRIVEQLGAIDLSIALLVGLHNAIGIRPIERFARPEHKERLLPLLASGRMLAAFALTEQGAGSNPHAVTSFARREASGLRLYGHKIWSGSAAWAGVINVFAKELDDDEDHLGLSAFAIPEEAPGLRQGPEALTMGMRGMIQNEVFLDGVLAQESWRLGEPGQGMLVAQDAMKHGRLGIAAMSLGAMKRSAQIAWRYASRRSISTGRLLDNHRTRESLSFITSAIEALAPLVAEVGKQADGEDPLPSEIYSACKILGPELLWSSLDRAMQLLGGRGYIETNDISRMMRDARVLRVFEGPTESMLDHLGGSVLTAPSKLLDFVKTSLRAPDVAETLEEGIQTIQSQHRAQQDLAAQQRIRTAAGSLAKEAVLWGAANASRNPGVLAWCRKRYEAAQAVTLETTAPPTSDELTHAIERYESTIGDVEQELPGPEQERDSLLRKHQRSSSPTPSSPVYPSRNADSVDNESYASLIQWLQTWMQRNLENAVSMDPSAPISAAGFDSLSAVTLASDLSEHLGAPVEESLIWNHSTFHELVLAILSKSQRETEPKETQTAFDLGEEASPPSSWPDHFQAPSSPPEVALLTGGTGFLGAFLLHELLEKTSLVVHCLVRAESPTDGMTRIRGNLAHYDLWKEEYAPRVHVVLGDLSKEALGWSAELRDSIAAKIDVIYHSGAEVNFIKSYDVLRGSNVEGTKSLLALAAHGRPKAFHLVSSVAVTEDARYAGATLDEETPVDRWEEITLGYSQSKWVAEQLVRAAMSRGLAATIHRPPLVSGSSLDGAWNVDDFTCRLIKACVDMGEVPLIDYDLDLAPVDFVARSVVYLSNVPESLGRTYHLTNPSPMSLRDFSAWLRSMGRDVSLVPFHRWQESIRRTQRDSRDPLTSLRRLFLETLPGGETFAELYARERRPQLELKSTSGALSEGGITCPPVDGVLLGKYFQHRHFRATLGNHAD